MRARLPTMRITMMSSGIVNARRVLKMPMGGGSGSFFVKHLLSFLKDFK